MAIDDFNLNLNREICYLCGTSFSGEINRDHVPPQQLYADSIRKNHNPNLLTLPVHKNCNSSYQFDEDYFAVTLMPLGLGSYSGNAFYSEKLSKFKQNKKVGLIRKILGEFEPRPSGLYLQNDKVLKRFDGVRLGRISWKIVRGLYFYHFKEFLPEGIKKNIRIVSPGEKPPPEFSDIINDPVRGQYPGVFDYRFTDSLSHNFHYWALLLWDRIILIIDFQYPACECDTCVASRVSV